MSKKPQDFSATEQAMEGPLWCVNNPVRVPLPLGLHCVAEVRPGTICKPDVSDELEADLVLHLPAVEGSAAGSGYLDPGLRFCGRLVILDGSLEACWGCQTRGTDWVKDVAGADLYRYETASRRGPTWLAALEAVCALARREVLALAGALQKREDALHSEGVEYKVAAKLLESK